jgi:hypothetical protein
MTGFGSFRDLAFVRSATNGLVLPALGSPYQGGFYAGLYSLPGNGIATHALIVAPAATGARGTGYPNATGLAWKTATTTTPGATSAFDGIANLNAIIAAGIADHPAAQFCHDLVIGGFDDWYPPSRFEADVAYFNLKPTTASNSTSVGANAYAVPTRAGNYAAAGPPVQTSVAAFQSPGGAEAFTTVAHWLSSETNATSGQQFFFANANSSGTTKTSLFSVRAFRRIAL